jgi:hypothetical protein
VPYVQKAPCPRASKVPDEESCLGTAP